MCWWSHWLTWGVCACVQALVKRAFGAPDLEEDFAQDKAEQVRIQGNLFTAWQSFFSEGLHFKAVNKI